METSYRDGQVVFFSHVKYFLIAVTKVDFGKFLIFICLNIIVLSNAPGNFSLIILLVQKNFKKKIVIFPKSTYLNFLRGKSAGGGAGGPKKGPAGGLVGFFYFLASSRDFGIGLSG